MAIEIVVPRLGWSMDEGTFVEWLKTDGEQVQAGDLLFVLEGDRTVDRFFEGDASTRSAGRFAWPPTLSMTPLPP